MDLYQCIRPVKYYAGVPSPVKHPEKLNVVIFRENTEDIYAGIEFREGTPEAKKFIDFVNDEMLKGTKKSVRRTPASASSRSPSSGPSGWSARPSSTPSRTTSRPSRSCTRAISRSSPRALSASGATRSPAEEFRDQTVTERESWILGNLEANPGLTPEANAALIEPGIEFAAKEFGEGVIAEVKDGACRHR